LEDAGLSSSIKPEETNLENLLSTLVRLPAAPRTVLLFTDGWETAGSVEQMLISLASSGLKIFPLVPLEAPEAVNVAIRKVLIPHQGTSGESVRLKVVIENQNAQEVKGDLILARNGRTFKSEAIEIQPGNHIFNYETALSDGPMVGFSARFVPRPPALDTFSLDNQATSWTAAQAKEKALLINGRREEGRYLEEILNRRGFETDSVASDSSPPSPDEYGIVIFNNVKKEKFSANYLGAIERHVSEGNAFLMLGGENSFGPGGYRETPIEKILPVKLIEPRKEERNRGVILVIDKSGSMRDQDKLLYAKEAAKAVASQLREKDMLGVVGFDVSPFVVVPLGSVERNREAVASQIDRLKAGGRTYLYPAIVEAKRQLEKEKTSRKHVIILSDGETGGSGGDYIDLVTVMKNELKITISTVAIGDQANIPLLKRIAQYGGGLFHHTFDPTSLPQIVLQQIQEEPPEEPPTEKDHRPVSVRESEILADFPVRSYPIVKGYIETEIKSGADLDLIIPKEGKWDPLLASWNYGKGKTAAFTTDLHGRWTKEWMRWNGLERFWAEIFEWLSPPKKSLPPYEIRVNPSGDRPVMDLYLYREKDNGGLFRYSFSGMGVNGEGMLQKLAPGHYRTTLPFSTPGDYRITLTEERGEQKVPYPPLGYTLAFDPRAEIPKGSFNISLLERLAQATGGEMNPQERQELSAQEVVRTASPLRSYPIFVALALFLLEIIFGRFFLPSI
jgi:uncharacterized membrane protein